jgi:hypothetical protein
MSQVAPSRDRHVGRSQIRDVSNDWVLVFASVPNKVLWEHFAAVIINMSEVVKGNVDAVQGMSLENVLDGHLSMYELSSAHPKIHSCNASLRGRGAMEVEGITGEVESTRQELKRSCPVPPNNHAKARKKSKREIINHQMMAAKRRNPSCSLCWDEGHKATGFKCRVVMLYKAYKANFMR